MNQFNNSTAVIYMRLSKDDKNDESLSITNQREIIRDFCSNRGICIVREFADDGFTGGNFDRPAFKAMIDFLNFKKVDLVITKDLSRLGRDMTEASMYAERYFTERGVRYITVTDNFDSYEDNLYAPFQFAMNDVYIRDTSRKIKAVISQKKKSGKYCVCPPYGYKKSTRNRDVLVPDEETAPIVKMIFDYASKGYSVLTITNMLTDTNVIPPLKYRVLYRDEFSDEGAAKAVDHWTYTTVKRIVQNRVYLGDSVFGKTKKPSPKSPAKIPVAKEDWLIVEGTHEPLVSREVFDLANDNIKRRTTKYRQRESQGHRTSVFRGITFCENCGAAMCTNCTTVSGKQEEKSYWHLVCDNSPTRAKNHCEHAARIKYEHLVKLVTDDLNQFIDLSDEQIDAVIQEIRKEDSAEKHNSTIQKQIDSVLAEVSDTNKVIEKLYRDNLTGKISDERLDALVASLEQKCKKADETVAMLKEQIIDIDSRVEDYERFFTMVKAYTHINELTPEIVNAFIDRIEIGERSVKRAKKKPSSQNVRIFYKFIGDKFIEERIDS